MERTDLADVTAEKMEQHLGDPATAVSYTHLKTAPDGFVLDEGVYGVSIEENGKTYTVENKAEMCIRDRPASVQH